MSIRITGDATPGASETVAGAVELATPAEAATGTDATRAVTPAGLPMRKIGSGWALGSGGDVRGTAAVDMQTTRLASTMVASGNYATVGGGQNNTASIDSATVGGGASNTASAPHATVGGGAYNTASGSYATVGGGLFNTASGVAATVGGGTYNTASGAYATVGGGRRAKADKYGQNSLAAGFFTAIGDAQTSTLVARTATTNATPAPLFLDGTSARITIADDTTWAFVVTVVARRTDANNESAAYQFLGCIDRNGGTTALVGSVTKTVIAEDSAAWDCNVTADDTNDALVVTVTGEAGKSIRWVARVELVEATG